MITKVYGVIPPRVTIRYSPNEEFKHLGNTRKTSLFMKGGVIIKLLLALLKLLNDLLISKKYFHLKFDLS